jgi:type IV fimbrial biogenesis protein FimT
MVRQGGFTLTEMVIVAAIVAILLGIAIPQFRYITNSYRMSSEVNGLLGDLMYARAEAIKEGNSVTVCTSANSTTCSGATTWQSGWIIYSNSNNAANPPAGSILRVQSAFTGTVPDTFVSNPGVSSVTYNREGFAFVPGAGFPNALLTLHEPTNNQAYTRCLTVSAQGLLRTETPATSIPAGACL